MSLHSKTTEIWRMTLNDFTKPPMIGENFSINGRRDDDYDCLWECAGDPESLRPAVWSNGMYSIHELIDFEPEGTFTLVHQSTGPVGFYMDAQCWIDPPHRGQKLSTQLILAAANFHGGSPVQNADLGLGYSPAGYAAHRAAYRHAVQDALAKGLPVPKSIRDSMGQAHLTDLTTSPRS
jgi:hypothetical protein